MINILTHRLENVKRAMGRDYTNVFKYVNKKSQMKTKILNKFIHKYTANIFTNIQKFVHCRLEKGKRAMGKDGTAFPLNLASFICSCSKQIHSYLSDKYKHTFYLVECNYI